MYIKLYTLYKKRSELYSRENHYTAHARTHPLLIYIYTRVQYNNRRVKSKVILQAWLTRLAWHNLALRVCNLHSTLALCSSPLTRYFNFCLPSVLAQFSLLFLVGESLLSWQVRRSGCKNVSVWYANDEVCALRFYCAVARRFWVVPAAF